ncbi:MAG TPA: phosphatase PAP2 family protein [Holophaga sp.]|nr:phosphatase PAP2 family protein [Holophaga sp.]
MIKILSTLLLALAASAPAAAQGCGAQLMELSTATPKLSRFAHLSSEALHQDLAVILWLQRTRTASDLARVRGDGTPTLECFEDVLDHDPNPQQRAVMPRKGYRSAEHPRTKALLEHARTDLLPLVSSLRNYYGRPRPYITFPMVEPAEARLSTPSFPSSSAALGCVYACILSQFRPDLKMALHERGRLLGTDRVVAGSHYPSDALGGEILGHLFATQWINQPEHRQLIMDVCKAEWE